MARISLPFRRKQETGRRKRTELSNLQIIWKTWNGKIGLTLLVVMVILALFAVAYYGTDGFKDYTQSNLWPYLYPESAPPCWVVDKAPGLRLSYVPGVKVQGITEKVSVATTVPGNPKLNALLAAYNAVYINKTYEAVFTYEAEGFAKPRDTALALVFDVGENIELKHPNFGNLTFVVFNVYLERPDGQRVYFLKGLQTVYLGAVNSYAGGVARNVTFLRDFYQIFVTPTSLNGLATTVGATTPVANTLKTSIESLALNITGGDKDAAGSLINTTGYGVVMYLTLDPQTGKAKVLNGRYRLHIEVNYAVSRNYVMSQGQYDPNLAKANNASIDPIAIEYYIKPNCFGLFGTDDKSRPIGLGLLFGLPYAFLLGFIVTFTSTFIGAFYGSAAGYWKDLKGEAMMRIVDVVNSLPFLPILIALSVAIKSINLWLLAILMIALFWAGPVIVVRSMALQISEQIYVEAARAVGASTRRILFRHIFPQVFPYTMAIAVLSMPGVIIAEAGLAVLGFGDPAAPTWGKMLEGAFKAKAVITGMWWYYLFPGFALVIFSAAFLMLGRALEPIVAPKLIK